MCTAKLDLATRDPQQFSPQQFNSQPQTRFNGHSNNVLRNNGFGTIETASKTSQQWNPQQKTVQQWSAKQ